VIGDYFDLEPYSHLVYTVKGDGHTYMANIRMDSLVSGGGDIWQAPFTTRRDGRWTEVRIPLAAFVMTNKGRLVERRMEMARDKVMSVGISVAAYSCYDYLRQQEHPGTQVQQRSIGEDTGGAALATAGSSSASSPSPSAASMEAAVPEAAVPEAAAGVAAPAGSASDGQEGGVESSKGGGVTGAEVFTSEFRLLLGEIRAEGRAGDEYYPFEQ